MTDKINNDLFFRQIAIGPMENFAYFIGSKSAKEIFLVDPGWDAKRLLDTASGEGMRIIGILLTHCHYDHVNGLDLLVDPLKCPVYIHKLDLPYVDKAKQALHPVEDGFKLSVGQVTIECLHTPGHSPGGQCFLAGRHLISGDTLFVDACGRTDLPGSDPGRMRESLKRLAALPDDVILCPGHNYGDTPTATMGNQKKTNPYLTLGDRG